MSKPYLTRLELFEVCQGTKSEGVMAVHDSAADNAAATLGSRHIQGHFTPEFLSHWYGSVQGILADGDGVTAEARSFFESHNVAY